MGLHGGAGLDRFVAIGRRHATVIHAVVPGSGMLGTLGPADKSAGLRRQQKKQQQFDEMGTGSHDMVRISPFC